MDSTRVLKEKKHSLFFLLVFLTSLAIAFVAGFAFAKATDDTRWIGWLVYYRGNPAYGQMTESPGPEYLRYSKDIVLGLRNDGVVVWKSGSIR